MQNHFNLSRFSRLFWKHTRENYKVYFMAWIVLIGIMGLILGGLAYLMPNPIDVSYQSRFYLIFMLGAGAVFTCNIFAHLGDKKTAIATLTLPASHLEKYLVGWLYSLPIFMILYTLAFYLVAFLVVQFDDWHDQPKELLNLFSPETEAYSAFWEYPLLHGIALVGAIFFQKMHFIKTAFIFFIMLMLLSIVNYKVIKAMLGLDIRTALPFSGVNFVQQDQFFTLSLPAHLDYFKIVFPLVMALVLWWASYIRLKERQV